MAKNKKGKKLESIGDFQKRTSNEYIPLTSEEDSQTAAPAPSKKTLTPIPTRKSDDPQIVDLDSEKKSVEVI